MHAENRNIIIYNTSDGKASVSLYAKDGMIWMNQNQLAELFNTSKQNIGQHIASILEDRELDAISVVKNYFTTPPMGKNTIWLLYLWYAWSLLLKEAKRTRKSYSWKCSQKMERCGKPMWQTQKDITTPHKNSMTEIEEFSKSYIR